MVRLKRMSVGTTLLIMESRFAVLDQSAQTTIATVGPQLPSPVSSIRADVGEVRTDFRWLLGGLAGLLGVSAHGFHWL